MAISKKKPPAKKAAAKKKAVAKKPAGKKKAARRAAVKSKEIQCPKCGSAVNIGTHLVWADVTPPLSKGSVKRCVLAQGAGTNECNTLGEEKSSSY